MTARLIPVEELYVNPAFSACTVSPDGERLAYLAEWEGRTNVFVRALDETHEQAVRVTSDARRGIRTYYWTDVPRYMLYLQDTDGDEHWHLHRVDLEDPGAPAVDLTPGLRITSVETMRTMPGTVLVQAYIRPGHVDMFRVDIVSGELTVHLEAPDAGGTYLIGPEGSIYYLLCAESDHAWEYYSPADEAGNRRLLTRVHGPSYPLRPHPNAVTPDGSGIEVALYPEGSDDLSWCRIDGSTGEITTVAAIPGRNVCDAEGGAPFPPTALRSKRTGEAYAIRFVGDRPTIHVIDPSYAELVASLSALFPDGVILNATSDKAERHWVVSFIHDRVAGLTFLYDRETGESRELFRSFPHLDPADLCETKGVHFTARDGLPLQAFLTLPQGVDPVGLPMVLYVHGGPWLADFWMYNPAVQFFANRGYAVLQVNFRGSCGFGQRHMLAALHEFAGAMHTDLIDGVEWAVQEGIADPARIGIHGGSYGGYSALVGVTFTPDVFAAAVDYVGISSLPNFIRTWSEAHGSFLPNTFGAYCGYPDRPEDLPELEARSPINLVDKIKTPLLVVHGARDLRVVQAEADNIVAALRANGTPVEYLLKEDEGHGFQNPENSFEMFRAVEKHFGTYLAGRTSA